MKRIITFLFGFIICLALQAQENQPSFSFEISTDSILMGNYFEVKFTLENANGKNFAAPTFEGFNVVGGPNSSMSTSIVNGVVTQSISYSYYLEPKDIGQYWIEPASIETGDNILETTPIEVLVVPNPDGIKQYPQQREQRRLFFDDFFSRPRMEMPQPTPQPAPKKQPQQPKKKKRKTVRI